MFFGIGLFELLLVLGVIAAPIVLLVFGIRALSRRTAPHYSLEARSRELEEELRVAQGQIEDMQKKLNETEEKLSFTHALLEGRKSEP